MRPIAAVAGAAVLLVTSTMLLRGRVESSTAGANDLRDEDSWTLCEIGPAVVRMGSAEGRGEYLFFGVTGARFLADGGVAVLNRYSQQVRLFDDNGRFLKTLGRRGDGPGELRDPIAIDLLGSDSIAVWDWKQGRVTAFDLGDGGHRSILLDPPAVNPTGSFGVVEGVGEASAFLVGSSPLAHFGGDAEGGYQLLNVLRYSTEGRLLDTLRVLPYGRSLWVDRANREAGRPWFQAQGVFRVRDGLLYTATADTSEVRVTPLAGRSSERVVGWTSPDRQVRPEHLDAHRAETFRRYDGNEYLTDRLQRVWNTMPAAERFPALDDIIVDEAGRIWVQQYPRPGRSHRVWWLFDAEGAFQCAARFPAGFAPLDFRRTSVLGRFTDALDVEFIEVRSIGHHAF